MLNLTNNTPLLHLLSFRPTTINTPENPLCSCRWNQEGKQQEMLYIEQITCSTLFILLLMSLYDMVQPYWTLWHCEKCRIQFDASFTVTHSLRCDPHLCRSNYMWEQSFITETWGKKRCDDFYYSWEDFNTVYVTMILKMSNSKKNNKSHEEPIQRRTLKIRTIWQE